MRIALALIACAGLGYVAGSHPVLPTDSQRSEPGPEKSAVTRIGPAPAPVETPLVEKLLPKEAATVKKSLTVRDGQLSPGGNFRWSATRRAWLPVDFGHVRHLQNKRPVTVEHLITEHGHNPASARKWTREEIEIVHANDHSAEYAAKQEAAMDCRLNGTCGNTTMGRGLFGRRR